MAIIVNNAQTPAPKIAILSDFIDFYDHTFYPRGMADAIWDRRSRSSMSKAEQFALLERLGFDVPEHGMQRL
ncbi:MAG: hypothetical protein JRJ31_23145 [Deltaproteobacteria bacterium]|nr:hypothetical protein [Deltaproteobacteria bacterium]